MPEKKNVIAVLSGRKNFAPCLERRIKKCKIVRYPGPEKFFSSLNLLVPDLIIADSCMPQISCADLVMAVRRNVPSPKTLIVIVENSNRPLKKTEIFSLGADEIIGINEGDELFIARINNLLERKALFSLRNEPSVLVYEELEINLDFREVRWRKKKINLTSLEFDMLEYFIRNAGRIMTRSSLISEVWRGNLRATPRSVDKRIEILRKKLGKFSSHLRTIFGVGYMLK